MRLWVTPWSTPFSILFVCTMLGCAGASSPATPGANEAAPPAQAPRVLVLGFQQEPAGFNTQLLQGTGGIGGVDMVPPIAQNYLMVQNPNTFAYVPQLALEAPAVDRGTWRLNPDGSMDTTWKLKPNIKWHDGTPFTSSDLEFSLRVYQDPEIPNSNRDIAARMTSVSTPDPQTFVAHWSSVFVQADRAPGLTPMPRHLLKDLYESDKSNFVNSPVFTNGFIGLGPFRLTHWEGGASMDFARFDDYYLGRPGVDGVSVRFLADPATTIANILAGAVDVVTSVGDLEAALQVKQRWEGTGNQVIVSVSGNLNHLEIQHRPEYAKLQHGLIERNTRAALYQAIDRATMTEVTTSGLAPAADSWVTPNDPLRSQLESAIPKFPYDPRRARELLAQGGFVAGPDGILVHQPDGERLEIMDYAGPAQARDQTMIADGWKAVGVDVNLYTIPPALDRERQTRSTLPGAGISQAPGEQFSTYKLHSSAITTPANGWSGLNRSGYVNPKVDVILDKLVTTIDLAQRIALHRELLQEQMGDIPIMPLNWPVRAALVLKGVQGVSGGTTWNINEWSKS